MPAYNPQDENIYETTTTCVSTGVPRLKLKVLKKFKKRIGLSGRGSDSSSLPPLLFNPVCGDNVRIEENGKVARRVESFCKGVAFSNRPVRIGERVYIRLLEISTNWSGVIRFGFTSQDPSGLRDALPKYVCPDLTNKPGYWAKALSERFSQEGLVLFYYVTTTGDVHFGINGEEKGVFFCGVETRSPLWVMVDVYGNSTAVELLDPLAQLNNRTRIVNDLRPGSTTANSRFITRPSGSPPVHEPSPDIASRPVFSHPPRPTSHEVSGLVSSMNQLEISNSCSLQESGLTPYPFHRVKGKNVLLNNNNTVARRLSSEYSHGYVFFARPINPGEQFIIKVLETEPVYLGALAFGLTAANPAGLDASDLPEDCHQLIDRPEYWVVSKDVASMPAPGDELSFKLTTNGEVIFYKPGMSPQVIMHVDHSLHLWPFFDVYGNTIAIKSYGLKTDRLPSQSPGERMISSQIIPSSSNTQTFPVSGSQDRNILAVNLPPTPPPCRPQQLPIQARVSTQPAAPSSGSPSSRSSMSPIAFAPSPGPNAPYFQECTVCYEKPVNSVLYTCGHMCMCYECAHQQWRGRGGGHCPICRAVIRDVIRTYRS